VHARSCAHHSDGLALELETSWGQATLRSHLLGDFNADNLLTVLGMLLAGGMALQAAIEVLAACEAPPGRMQLSGGDRLPLAIVDYAHTPDALEKALRAARAHCAGKLLCVFGCGGDRDRGKRPEMARVAESLADAIYITDDNPRSEDPRRIVADISAGLRDPARAHIEHDRAAAIAAALAAAAQATWCWWPARATRTYQLVGGERRAFSDLAQVRAALAEAERGMKRTLAQFAASCAGKLVGADASADAAFSEC
jgi:UDP-N-acetylmuramoyl-L-alanyl-D-glutamate--2,6-diaminopimelate ligase